MKLSVRSKHGLRMMVNLAIHYGKGYLQMKDIAKTGGISQKYVEQLISKPVISGMVKSHRGANGGYVLGAPPSKINLGMIVNELEMPDEPTGCAKHKRFSKGCCGCVMGKVWAKLEKNASDYLDSTTLQDLIDMEK